MALPIREGDIPGIQLRARRRLGVDRAEAWRWLTERDRLQRWLADRVEVDTGPRGGLRLERDTTAGPVVEIARTERFDPQRAWILSFRREDPHWEAPTRLEIALLEADRACELDVLQNGFHLLAMSWSLTIWEEYRRRWRDALERLADQSG
ncbi:MAG TPA: SRPBCC domain-containing protein [Thermoanaerobaculia bacterium]|jgi:uncharacterized protein YndB with AHSA1/START domain|nr:SRPBCC domain-containing protein [Thermoanaerobaculia bacterium]